MGKPFETWHDSRGDIWVRKGQVICAATGAVFEVGGAAQADAPPSSGVPAIGSWLRSWISFEPPAGATCLGGSGSNVFITCPVAGIVGGLYRPSGDGEWTSIDNPAWTLDWFTDGTTSFSDGTIIVASAGTAGPHGTPTGVIGSTVDGAYTYNGTTAFDVTLAHEGGSANYPAAVVMVSAGTVQTGTYSATAANAWQSDDDTDWTITPDGSGNMELADATDVVAIRTGGADTDPAGYYLTTEYGRATFHADADFAVEILVSPAVPTSGVVYLTVTEDGTGEVASVAGPFLAAALPAQAGLVFPVPIAKTGTGGHVQILDAPLVWRSSPAAGSYAEIDGGDATTVAVAEIDCGTA